MGRSVRENVAALSRPIVEGLGYEYVDTEYSKQGRDWFLTVFADKPGGMTIEDCEALSRAIGSVLDEKDPIPGSYTLVVSSPGLDRPLKTEKDFQRAMGTEIDVKLYQPFMGKKVYTGTLVAADAASFAIEDGDNEIRFQKEETAQVVPHLDI